MAILRVLWLLVGIFVTLRFGYFFVMEVGYAFSLCDEPKAGTLWLSLAYSGAMLLSARGDIESVGKILGTRS